MSTTTIRLPDELKARIAEAAGRAGTSPHSFILEAIAEKTEAAERQADFHDEAERRYARIVETGETLDWDEYRASLLARAK
jgi:predicted transcriptional regulator